MHTCSLPLVVLASLASGTLANLCKGPNARTEPPTGAIIVDATGAYHGSFRTVTEGVANIPNTTDEHTLFVFPGVYREQVFINPLNGPLVLQGYTCDTMSYAANQVTITQAKAQRDISPDYIGDPNYPTSTLGLPASNVKMYNLNVANTAGKIGGKVGQAVAAYVGNGTDYGFYGCKFSSYQDTLCAMNGRQLYARSYIGGAVDFIFGKQAQAWFEDCDIESVGQGYVTANGRYNESNPSWYVFNRARVFGPSGVNSTYLGRPWRTYSRVVFENSDLSDIVRPEGWKAWNNDTDTTNIFYKEFNNTGPGAATDKRVAFSGTLDKPVLITDIFGDNYKSNWWVDTKFL
ncbi:Pectin methylesterase [Phytophthora cinnamomi]|uniref:Pectin methylesterase n=1 Tax=Phytophthora cinnamomi TaxID=4785 RepID=UPI00355A5303|nr:Pectin methylesterase [Phytophthora cinnamomi]